MNKFSKRPDPNLAFPNPNLPRLCFIKNVVKNPRIIIGDYTYYDDVDGADQFEKHVTHFYVMPGVHIGDGAIIGANSVVASDIPPYTVAAGNPCRVIRKRFDEELIAFLLDLKWWDWEIEKIEENFEALSSGNLSLIREIGK